MGAIKKAGPQKRLRPFFLLGSHAPACKMILYKFADGLTSMHKLYIIMHMRTTINIDDDLIKRASLLTGINEKTSLVRLGLKALIAQESAKRLAKLGGTEKELKPVHRRRVD